jgi:hypothetical protein
MEFITLCITTCLGPYGPSSGEYNISFFLFSNIFEIAIVNPTDPFLLTFFVRIYEQRIRWVNDGFFEDV